MKLNFRTLTILFTMLALLVTGCGGGGGGGGGSVQDRLTSRMGSLSNGLKSGNTNTVMSNFSESYYDSGTDYWDYRAFVADFFAEGGRSWLENLRGWEFVQIDNTHASRRFTAVQAVKIYGDTTRTSIDAWETFRLEDGKWLIYGSQRSNRGAGTEQEPSFSSLLKIKKPTGTPPPTAPTPPDHP
ncbi:MAG: hypothetical protein AAB669_03980 [Patescibacteria group bacterium]